MLSQEQFKAALPKQMQKNVNQELIDKVNDTLRNPDTREMLRDNLLGYASVMQQGKFKVDQYINAVKYVSFKTMGDTNIAAYTKTFPDKYQSFLDRGVKPKDVASYVTAYNKSKLVTLIYEQSLVPVHILNADKLQAAINNLAEIMVDPDVIPRDRVAASIGLLNNIKAPETKKIELDIGVKEDSTLTDLRASTLELVEQQKRMLKEKVVTAKDIAHSDLVIGSASEVIDA